MATINLGAIKFNWKGAYNSSTSYAVDDVVSSGGNSYVCIQAHSNQAVGNATAYWNIMSSAGTNGTNGTDGTDVGTVLTTQGDILYRDGSGLQRLPKGTANQVLKMNSGATAPEYGTLSSDFVKLGTVTASNSSTLEVNGFYDDANYSHYKLVFENIRFENNTQIMFRVKNSSGTLTSNIYEGATRLVFPYHDGSGLYYDCGQNHYNTNYSSGDPMNRFEVGLNNNSSDIKGRYQQHTNANMSGELFSSTNQATNCLKAWHGMVNYSNRTQNYTGRGFYIIQMHVQDSTAHTGFVLDPSSGNVVSGSMHLYGYKK